MKSLLRSFVDTILNLGFVNRWRLRQIARQADPQQVEFARDQVQGRGDIEALIQHYWQKKDWQRKRAIVELLQDQVHPALSDLMLDFLRAPVPPGDEPMELAKATALGFIDEKYDQYMDYYNDRTLLERTVRDVLAANGLQLEILPAPPGIDSPPVPLVVSPDLPPGQRLLEGIRLGNRLVVEQALRAGAFTDTIVDKGNHAGCSALMYATALGRYEIASELIHAGADVHYTRPDLQGKYVPGRGQSALWWAANQGQVFLAEALIQRGANVNTPDHHGGTPLTSAASSGRVEMVQYLLQSGADIHAKISDGRTAFGLAVTNGHLEIVRLLIDAGNDPNERGGSGYSPLMVAAEHNFYDLACLLIEKGADVNARHRGNGIYIAMRGWTPLVCSVNAGLVRMSKMLIQAGADVHYRVPAGQCWDGKALPARNLLDFATEKRAKSLQELFKAHGLESG